MKIRILCLHGMGTNASIFKHQTASLRRALSSDYEFTFIDGSHSCDPAPGAAALFPGPYRCWYDTPTTTKVERAHREIISFVQTNGPFDGVMGFSQGAALVASVLLHHELNGVSSPFNFAIFICSPVPFSHSLANGIDARTAFGAPRTTLPVRPAYPDVIPSHLMADSKYLRGEDQLKEGHSEESFYQMFFDTVDNVRISTRTGHVIGTKDEWRRHSETLVDLCVKQSRTVLYHQGGHEIPESIVEESCDLIETLAMESRP